jgi:hypothetical protein
MDARLTAGSTLERSMKRAIFLVATMLVTPFATATAQAVMTRFGVEAATFYATVDGDDVELIDAGFGFDVQGRIAWPRLVRRTGMAAKHPRDR